MELQKLSLRELNENDEAAFLIGLQDWNEGDLAWYSFTWAQGMTFLEMLKILRKEALGIDLAPGRVRRTMLYAFLNDKIIGRLSVRHELNEFLRHRGGHVGYSVAPKYRKQGYATEIMKQGLVFCKTIGLNPILVTCSDTNIASCKIIEKFNGKLEDKVFLKEDNETIRRYWIDQISG